jgi:regulator of chromosome condensation
LAVGGMHCAALTYDNTILTWGVNDLGALGRDTTWDGGLVDISDAEDDVDAERNPKESTPGEVDLTGVPGDTIFTQVAAGDNCTFALTSQGTIYGWGTMRVCLPLFNLSLHFLTQP